MNHSLPLPNPSGGDALRRGAMQPVLHDDLMERVLARENVWRAWKRVKANKGAPGIDGMGVEDFAEFARSNWSGIRQALRDGTYQPQPVRRVSIPKPKGGGERLLGIPTIVDRVIQQAIAQVLTPIFDLGFSESSFGFRPGRCAHGALRQVQRFIGEGYRIAVDKDPRLLTMDDVKAFLSFLAVERKVSASSQNQAFNALLFLFRHVLEKEFGQVEGVVRAKRKPYFPVVLSREEVDLLIAQLEDPYDLVAKVLYGCGLRLFEGLKLRVQDLDFDLMRVTVHDGKGRKDRTVPMPEALVGDLKSQMEYVSRLHQEDLTSKYTGCFLPDSLERKYPNAAKELAWQWVFPAKTLTLVP